MRFVYDAAMPDDMLKYIMKKLGMAKKDNAIPGGRYHNFKNLLIFLPLVKKIWYTTILKDYKINTWLLILTLPCMLSNNKMCCYIIHITLTITSSIY